MAERCRAISAVSRAAQLRTLEGGSVPHVTQKQIRSVLDSNRFKFSVGHASFVLQCPFCGEPRSGGGGRRTMFVNKTTGGVVCKPCDVKGEEDAAVSLQLATVCPCRRLDGLPGVGFQVEEAQPLLLLLLLLWQVSPSSASLRPAAAGQPESCPAVLEWHHCLGRQPGLRPGGGSEDLRNQGQLAWVCVIGCPKGGGPTAETADQVPEEVLNSHGEDRGEGGLRER